MANPIITNNSAHKKTSASFKSVIGWVLTIVSWAALFFIGYVAFSIKSVFDV